MSAAVANLATEVLNHELVARAGGGTANPERPPAYKAVGISLAIASGLFIGTSFVLKKVGLLKANVKYNEEAGEGYGYLKNFYWWSGMTLMIIGEICNFVAYAFVDAILVTPLGALSVVITTILSAIFLKERLSFVGKVGCFICIVGSIIIVLNAPEQSSAATIEDMQGYVIHPGFLTYAGCVIVGCACIAIWVAPKYGKKSMMVYLTICSLVGGLSVVATQGLGAAVVAQAGGRPQFNQWFLYVLLVFVICTLLTEIIYLNKALNLFNAALVTPTYYVYFTSATIVSSAILFRGFKGTPISIATIVMGFFQICAGVILLQLSKSSKDVPDTKVLAGDLDQIRTAGEQEQPESEPKADAIRGTAAIIRRISQSRQKKEADEAKRVYEDRLRDQMEPINENEQVEWDGIRRRKTIIDHAGIARTKTLHPPLGLSKFPSYDEDQAEALRPPTARSGESHGFLQNFRRRTSSTRNTNPRRGSTSIIAVKPEILPQRPIGEENEKPESESHEMSHIYGLPPGLAPPSGHQSGTSSRISPGTHTGQIMWADGSDPEAEQRRSRSRSKHIILTPNSPQSPSPRPAPTARRQFSFQNMFTRNNSDRSSAVSPGLQTPDRRGIGSRGNSGHLHTLSTIPTATEEERLGLVHGDSSNPHLDQGFSDEDTPPMSKRATASTSHLPLSDSQRLKTQDEYLEPPRSSRPSTSLPNIRRSTELGRATDRAPRQVYDSDEEGEKEREKDVEGSSGRDKETGSGGGTGAFL